MLDKRYVRMLQSYLNETNIKLKPNEFSGVLCAINCMLNCNKTKASSLEYARDKYKISKRKADMIIRELGIKSERFIASSKEYGSANGLEVGGFKAKVRNI